MAKQLLIETMLVEATILEEASAKNSNRMKVRCMYDAADEINGNGRVYPEAIGDREMNKLSALIAENVVAMEADHPADGKSRVLNTVAKPLILEKKIENGRKLYFFEAFINNTTKGKDLQEIIRSGLKIGASKRGWGNVVKGDWKGTAADIVQEDYTMKTIDFVIGQSVKDAVITDFTEQKQEVINLFEAGSCEGCPKENQLNETKGGLEKMEIKTLEELRKAYPELCLQLEGEAKTSREKELKEAMQVEWEAKTKEIADGIKKQIEESQEYKDFKAGMEIHKATLIEIGKLVKPYISDSADDDDDALIGEQVRALKTELETARGESKALKEQMEREKKEAGDKEKATKRIDEVTAGKEYGKLLVESLSSCRSAEEVDKMLPAAEAYIAKVIAEVKPGDQPKGKGHILDENKGEELSEQQKRDQRVAGIA